MRDQYAVLNAMVDALWSGRDKTVLIVEPERMKMTPAEVPELDWRPEGSGGTGDPDGERRQKLVGKGNTVPAPKTAPPSAREAGAKSLETKRDGRSR